MSKTLTVKFHVADQERFERMVEALDNFLEGRENAKEVGVRALEQLEDNLFVWSAEQQTLDSAAIAAFKNLNHINYIRGHVELFFAFRDLAEFHSRRILGLFRALRVTITHATLTDDNTSMTTVLKEHHIEQAPGA
jgi:hypothetical protein